MAKFNEYETKAKEYNVGGDDKFKFKVGDNPIRIVTELEEYPAHFVKAEGKQYTCLGKKCAFCAKGTKIDLKFIGWIIDRTEKKEGHQFKLCFFPYSIYKQIGVYSMSKDYAFDSIPPYDINVKREGEELLTRYTVLPDRKDSELTESEMSAIVNLKQPKEIVNSMRNKYPGKEADEQASPTSELPIIDQDEVEDEDESRIKDKDLPF